MYDERNEKNKPDYRTETKKFTEAFNLYCKLKLSGHPDAFQGVADKFNVKIKTVYNWSNRYGWKDRFLAIQKEARDKALARISDEISRQEIRSIEKALERMREVEDNISGSAEGAYSMRDYEIMVKIVNLLIGKSTERVESINSGTTSMTEEDREMIKALEASLAGRFNKVEEEDEDEEDVE